jgi:Zn-dependent protease with chaperone function
MLEAHFRELVEELEVSAQQSDVGYRLRVALLAALGYLYVVGVVALLLGALWLVFLAVKDGRHLALLKLAIPMALLALVGLRALWVRLEPPEGTPLTREEAPQLFELLDRIRKRLKGPPIHQVVVDPEYNAAIVQHPRLGLLGGGRNYLIIGLPLMQTLSVEQFAAVLSHEYGHLSGAHGHFASWIYRVRMTWARILDALHARPVWGSGVFLHFFDWYVPYFAAYTFVLARSNEYEADRAAADVAGARAAADALAQVEVGARFFDGHFWPKYLGGADKSPVPVFLPYSQLPLSLHVGLEGADAEAWLKAALLEETGITDTHPCLKDRLEALGEAPRVPGKPETPAARVLLGPQLGKLVGGFDKAWAKENLREWGERHREGQALKTRAEEISAKAKSGAALNAAEWHDFARACERFATEEKAEAYYRKAIEVVPRHHESHLALGRLLLRRRDAKGIPHLDKAIAGGGDAALEASMMAARFLRESGRPRDAERYETKSMAHMAREEEKAVQRVLLMPDDNYAAHGLSDKELALCRAAFRRLPRVYEAHAVRKVLPGAGELHLVFLVTPKVGLLELLSHMVLTLVGVSPRRDTLDETVWKALRLPMPFTVYLDVYQDDAVAEQEKTVDGSLNFARPDR